MCLVGHSLLKIVPEGEVASTPEPAKQEKVQEQAPAAEAATPEPVHHSASHSGPGK